MSNRDYYGDAAPQDYSYSQGNAFQQSDLSKSSGSNPNKVPTPSIGIFTNPQSQKLLTRLSLQAILHWN